MATIPELLDGHITLEVECLDRLYLNGYIGRLATGPELSMFMRNQLGKPVPSPVVLGQVSERFREAVKTLAEREDIPIHQFKHEERKDDISPVFRHSCRGAAPIDARCGPSTPASDPPAATAARASSPPWRPAFSPARPGNAPGSGSRGLVHNTAHVEPQLGCHAGSRSPTAPPPLSPAVLATTAPNTS